MKFAGKTVNLPGSRLLRVTIGAALIIGGILGFLPVLGFWMIPLGLLVLSVDFPIVRKWRRKMVVRFGFWLKKHSPGLARRFGFGSNGKDGIGDSPP